MSHSTGIFNREARPGLNSISTKWDLLTGNATYGIFFYNFLIFFTNLLSLSYALF